MKTIQLLSLFVTTWAFLGLVLPAPLRAADLQVGGGRQTPAQASVTALDTLSPTERQKYQAARRNVLAQSPTLAAGEADLRGLQRKVLAGKISKEAALAKMRSHRDKMDAALRKVKPTIVPILEKLEAAAKDGADKHAKKLKTVSIQ